MTQTITFTVMGEPFGKQRPRFMRNGHAYTPAETREHEELIRAAYIAYCGRCGIDINAPFFGANIPVYVAITAYFKIPKTATKAKRRMCASGEIKPTVKPDWDNIGKLVTDALNGLAYADDKQVCYAAVSKLYATDDIPRVEIEIQGEYIGVTP